MTNNQNDSTTLAANLASVRAIGKGARVSEVATAAIVATAPEGFDFKARGAVTGLIHAWACGEGERPAVATGGKGEQTPTDYGRGVDALRQTVRRAFAAMVETPDETPVMRVSLKGAGSAVVPVDSPAYAILLALLGVETDADETDETDADETPALKVA